ncbi:MAG: hypothetical protein Fur0032_22350 [Terrimicrobiaceae bacterium]
MKYYDTSALLRAWKDGWIPAKGMTRSHSVAEWVAIQTGRGMVYRRPDGRLVKQNLSPTDAANEAVRLFSRLSFHDLTGSQTLEAAIEASKRPGVQGGSFHDFLHARTAEVFGAESIVTLNLEDFRRMTTLPIEAPMRQ